jgi:hypothetical protein
VRCAEVAHTNRAHPSVSQKLFGGTIRGDRGLEIGRHRPVEQVEIEVVHTELAQADIERTKRRLIAVVAHPEFDGDEQLSPLGPQQVASTEELTLPASFRKLVLGKYDSNTARPQRLWQVGGVVHPTKAGVRVRRLKRQVEDHQGVRAIQHEIAITDRSWSARVRG